MGDERTLAPIGHWAPRFVSNGVPLHDFQTVTSVATVWDDWCRLWVERGREHERRGDAAVQRGHTIAAGEHLRYAALCYHFGKFVVVQRPDEMRAAHELAVAAYDRAIVHLDRSLRRARRRVRGPDRRMRDHLRVVLRGGPLGAATGDAAGLLPGAWPSLERRADRGVRRDLRSRRRCRTGHGADVRRGGDRRPSHAADRLTPHTAGVRMAEEASGPTVLDVVDDGNHVVNNMPYRYRPQVADWMNAILRQHDVRPSGPG